jgi:hypothetical protein
VDCVSEHTVLVSGPVITLSYNFCVLPLSVIIGMHQHSGGNCCLSNQFMKLCDTSFLYPKDGFSAIIRNFCFKTKKIVI